MDAREQTTGFGNLAMTTAFNRGSFHYDDGGRGALALAQFQADGAAGSKEECLAKIAEMKLREKRKSELRAAISKANSELETGVVAHGEACGPIQFELKRIDQEEVVGILEGDPMDIVRETRRIELRNQVDHHNDTLQDISARCRRKIELLENELNAPELNTDALTILQDRLLRDFADPVLKNKLAAISAVLTMFDNLERSLQKAIGETTMEIECCKEREQPFDEYLRRRERFQSQSKVLGSCVRMLSETSAELLRKIRE
jgi:hypothetical protein